MGALSVSCVVSFSVHLRALADVYLPRIALRHGHVSIGSALRRFVLGSAELLQKPIFTLIELAGVIFGGLGKRGCSDIVHSLLIVASDEHYAHVLLNAAVFVNKSHRVARGLQFQLLQALAHILTKFWRFLSLELRIISEVLIWVLIRISEHVSVSQSHISVRSSLSVGVTLVLNHSRCVLVSNSLLCLVQLLLLARLSSHFV